MAYLIDFDAAKAIAKLEALEGKLSSLAVKSNQISSNLQSVGSNKGGGYSKLADEAKKAEGAAKNLAKENEVASNKINETGKVRSNIEEKRLAESIAKNETAAKAIIATNEKVTRKASSNAKAAELFEKRKLQKIVTLNKSAAKTLAGQLSTAYRSTITAEKAFNDKLLETTRQRLVTTLALIKEGNARKEAEELRSLNKELKQLEIAEKRRAILTKRGRNRTIYARQISGGSAAEVARQASLGGTGTGFAGLAAAEAKITNRLAAENAAATKSYRELAYGAKGAGKAISETGKKVKKASKGMSMHGGATSIATHEAAALRAGINALGTSFGMFTSQTIVTALAVYGTVTAFKSMISVGSSFTTEMTRALAIMGANRSEAAALSAEVRRLAENTIFTGTETAQGLTALAMAGMSASQAMAALAPALNLAAIGQIDMYKSADILTNVMLGFKLNASDTEKIVSDLSTAITSSNSTIDQMGTALSYVAPIAAAAGSSIEEVVSILELFHNVGIKGSRAGVSLRRAYSNLLKPSNEAANVLGRLNIATINVNGGMLDLTDIMKELATQGATTSDIISLFGSRAGPAMQAFLDDVSRALPATERFRTALENNAGAADTLRTAMNNALGPDTKKLLSALEEKAIQMFKSIEPSIRSMVKATTQWIKLFETASINSTLDTLKVMVGTLAKYSGAIKTIVGSFLIFKGAKYFMSILGAVVSWVGKLGVALEGAAFGAGALIIAVKTLAKATAVGMAVSFGIGAIQRIYDWANAEEKAAEKTHKLALALERKNKAASAAQLKISNAGTPLEAIKGTKDQNLKRLETLRITAFSDFKAIETRYLSAKNALPLIKELGTSRDVQAITNILDSATKEYKVAISAYTKTVDAVKTYISKGLTPTGVLLQKQFSSDLGNLDVKSFTDTISQTFSLLSTESKGLQSEFSSGGKSATDILLGTREEIASASISLELAFQQIKDKKTYKLSNIRKDKFGNITETKKYLKVKKELLKLENQYEDAQNKLADALANSDTQFATNTKSISSAVTSGGNYIISLQQQHDKLLGVAGATRSLGMTKLDLALIEASIATEKLSSEGYTVEAKAMQGKVNKLTEMIQLTYSLEKANISLAASKKASTKRDKLKSEFAAGKGLSTNDKARAEYDAGIQRLNDYVALNDELLATDQWYVDAKDELNQKMVESQNRAWFQMSDRVARSVGDNIAQAVTLQKSWGDTVDSIKKAIVGGFLGTLVQVGIEMAAQALLTKIFGAEEVATIGAVTTAKVVGETAKKAAVVTTSAVEVAASAVTAGGMLSSIGGLAGALAVAWEPAAWLASLATLGLNAIPAMVGIAATSALTGALAIASGVGGMSSGSRANGGPVLAGGSYIVGERGREVFTPQVSGTITPNDSIGNKSANTVNNYYTYEGDSYNIDAVDVQSFEQRLVKSSKLINNINNKQDRRRAVVR